MNRKRIAELTTELEALQETYKGVAIDYVKFQDEFIGKLIDLGDKIHAVKGEIRMEKMPREEGQ